MVNVPEQVILKWSKTYEDDVQEKLLEQQVKLKKRDGCRRMIGRGEQFHSMYTEYWLRKVFQDHTHRAIYKHWNSWCFHKGRGLYCFDKGYDEDYAKRTIWWKE